MTRLVEALRALGLDAEVDLAGHWARLRGERYRVYVVEAAPGCYYTWCAGPGERVVRFYADPIEAVRVGLGRAVRGEQDAGADRDTGRRMPTWASMSPLSMATRQQLVVWRGKRRKENKR